MIRAAARPLTFLALASLAACGGRAPQAPPPAGSGQASPRPIAHPLDQLSREEVRDALAILRDGGRFGVEDRLLVLTLEEPTKAELHAWQPGTPFQRDARAVVLQPGKGEVAEAIVDLRARKVASFTRLEGLKPWLLDDEGEDIPDLVRKDPRWREAMKKRGITDLEKVVVDCWTTGVLGEDADGHRYVRAISWYNGDAKGPVFGRPVEGVAAIVDARAMKVVRVTDSGVRPLSKQVYDLETLSGPLPAATPAPAGVPQPFVLEGNHVHWKNWDFRFSLHPREGLVLHAVGFEDRGTLRSILHRASLSELVVPYADPDPDWAWRSAFDVGEEGLGSETTSLQLGREVPMDARLVDVTFAGEQGEIHELPRAIAIYERDAGLTWKHRDKQAGTDIIRRGRELVVTSYTCLDNYDYGFTWIFSEDGALEMQVSVTGILLVKGVSRDSCAACADVARGDDANLASSPDEKFGALVDDNLVAPNHQHFLNYRLDFDIDGAENSVVEMNAGPPPETATTPELNAFVVNEHVLRDEREAAREASPATHRFWKVVNPTSKNALGHLRGYAVVPGPENAVPYMGPKAKVRRQAGFMEKQLFVTHFRPGEMNAAGPFPDQVPGSNGLPQWIAGAEPIVATDVVLWHTFGITHHPRPEEWPIMSITKMGFKLIPVGFFDRNPAIEGAATR